MINRVEERWCSWCTVSI